VAEKSTAEIQILSHLTTALAETIETRNIVAGFRTLTVIAAARNSSDYRLSTFFSH
jgi:hypothetical protein